MTKLDDMAFDAADCFCKCEEGEPCDAQAYMEGFIAGFKTAREMAAQQVANTRMVMRVPNGKTRYGCSSDEPGYDVLEMDTAKRMAKSIELLGEEKVAYEKA